MRREFPPQVGGYQIDLLFQGFPGKATHNGGLGWSTIALLRGHGRTILLDTGSVGQRVPLKQRLGALGLDFDHITDVLLTHSHWDHICNYPVFTKARLYIGRTDLDWANSGAENVYAVAELYARELAREARLSYLEPGSEVFPDLHCALAPGHTPGHLIFVLKGPEFDVIFAQDAAKSKAELVSRDTDLTIDAAQSRGSIGMIWDLWQAREGSIVVPGHDLPMVQQDGRITLLGERKAGIVAFLGENLKDETVFALNEGARP